MVDGRGEVSDLRDHVHPRPQGVQASDTAVTAAATVCLAGPLHGDDVDQGGEAVGLFRSDLGADS